MVEIANRVKSIDLSQIRKMFEAAGEDSINLGIGEPDFDIPENVKLAIKQALDEGETHYTPNNGYIELREAIVNKFAKENNIKKDVNDIMVTAGASEALYVCAQALFNKGDNILIPNPGFLAYSSYAKLTESNPVEVTASFENGFKLTVDDVQEKIDDKTKALILNSPSNPTGAVMDKEDIKGIADLATDHDFMIIADEIYEKIIYGKKHYSAGAYSDNVITINGFSKTYAMTGLRVAYLAGNEYINDELLKVHQNCVACASSIAQKGALEALTGPQDAVKSMVKEFSRRKDLIVTSLRDMGYECSDCDGAFYAFPKIERPQEFVKKAAEAGVVCVPGAPFGSAGANHVRMSYANSYENIEKAMNIIKDLEY